MNIYDNIINKTKSGLSSYNKTMEGVGASVYDWANPNQDPIQRFLDDPKVEATKKQAVFADLQAGKPKEAISSYIAQKYYPDTQTQFHETIPMAKPLFPATGKENFLVGSAKLIGNAPTSLWNLGAGTVNVGSTAIQEGVGNTANMLGKGIVRSAGQGADALQQEYQKGGGGVIGTAMAGTKLIEGAQKLVTEDPSLLFAPQIVKGAGTLATKGSKALARGAEVVAPKVTNAIIKTPQALGKGVTTGTEYSTSLATGLSREAQQTIKSAPKLYKEARLGNITAQGELESFVKATETRLDDLSELGKGYESIKLGNKVASADDITNAYVKATDGIRDTQLTKADRLVIKDANDYMSQLKGQLDETDILGLRRQLDSIMYDPNTGLKRKVSPTGERVVNSMRAEVDRIAKERIAGLTELDAKYGPEVSLLKDVKKQIYDANGNVKPNALSTISNIVGKNKDFKLEQFQKIYPELGARIKALKAFEEVQALGEIKTGSIARQGGAIAMGSALAPGVGTVIGWLATNPYIVARILETYGIAKAKIQSIISKGSKITPEEANIVAKAVAETPKSKVENIINNLAYDPKTNKLSSKTLTKNGNNRTNPVLVSDKGTPRKVEQKTIVKPNTIKNESKVSEPVVVPKKIVNTPIVKKSSVESKVDGVFPASSKNGSKLEWNPKMKTPQDIFYLDRNGIRQTEFEGKGVAIKGNRTGYTMDEYLKNNGLSKSDFTLLEGTKGEDGLYILNDKGNKKLLNIKSQNVKQSLNKPVSGDTIPEGYFKNAFGEIQKNPSNKKGGFIKIPEIGKKVEPLIEEAKKYNSPNDAFGGKDVLYHGTTMDNLESIFKKGLLNIKDDKSSIKKIYLSSNIKDSERYTKIYPSKKPLLLAVKDSIEFGPEGSRGVRTDFMSTRTISPKEIALRDDTTGKWVLLSDIYKTPKSIPVKNPLVKPKK